MTNETFPAAGIFHVDNIIRVQPGIFKGDDRGVQNLLWFLRFEMEYRSGYYEPGVQFDAEQMAVVQRDYLLGNLMIAVLARRAEQKRRAEEERIRRQTLRENLRHARREGTPLRAARTIVAAVCSYTRGASIISCSHLSPATFVFTTTESDDNDTPPAA